MSNPTTQVRIFEGKSIEEIEIEINNFFIDNPNTYPTYVHQSQSTTSEVLGGKMVAISHLIISVFYTPQSKEIA